MAERYFKLENDIAATWGATILLWYFSCLVYVADVFFKIGFQTSDFTYILISLIYVLLAYIFYDYTAINALKVWRKEYKKGEYYFDHEYTPKTQLSDKESAGCSFKAFLLSAFLLIPPYYYFGFSTNSLLFNISLLIAIYGILILYNTFILKASLSAAARRDKEEEEEEKIINGLIEKQLLTAGYTSPSQVPEGLFEQLKREFKDHKKDRATTSTPSGFDVPPQENGGFDVPPQYNAKK